MHAVRVWLVLIVSDHSDDAALQGILCDYILLQYAKRRPKWWLDMRTYVHVGHAQRMMILGALI